jgi:hypothetical protein
MGLAITNSFTGIEWNTISERKPFLTGRAGWKAGFFNDVIISEPSLKVNRTVPGAFRPFTGGLKGFQPKQEKNFVDGLEAVQVLDTFLSGC